VAAEKENKNWPAIKIEVVPVEGNLLMADIRRTKIGGTNITLVIVGSIISHSMHMILIYNTISIVHDIM
jgi:hypothetical protein